MILYRLLLPPPRQRTVMRPVLLRPPLPRSPPVSDLTGFPFHSSLRSTITSCRRDGVVGLKVFNAIASDPRRDVDPLTLAEGHDRFFVIRAPPETPTEALELARDSNCVHGSHANIEQAFDCRLDLPLGGDQRHAKDHLIVFREICCFLGDHGTANDIVHLLAREPRRGPRDDTKPAHLSLASR